MKRILAGTFCVFLVGHAAVAQVNGDEKRGAGYVFVAPGAAVTSAAAAGILHFGVGGQGLLYKGLGIGGEIGYMSPAAGLSEGVGLLSVNALYQFGRAGAGRKAVPFVTAGYSLAFRGGSVNGLNLGGGLNYWFRDRKALLIEIRDYVSPAELGVHLLTCRIGLSFR